MKKFTFESKAVPHWRVQVRGGTSFHNFFMGIVLFDESKDRSKLKSKSEKKKNVG